VKGKADLLQAWSGPEGSRKLRFPDYITAAQDGGKFSLTHWPPLPSGNSPGIHLITIIIIIIFIYCNWVVTRWQWLFYM